MTDRSGRALRVALAVLLGVVGSAHAGGVVVRSVEALEGDETIIRIHLSGPLGKPAKARLLPKAGDQPDRLTVDLPGASLGGKASREKEVGWGGITRMRLGVPDATMARLVLDLTDRCAFTVRTEGDAVDIVLSSPPEAQSVTKPQVPGQPAETPRSHPDPEPGVDLTPK